MVTSGATEALAGALMALIEPGDEVVLFEPMYDAYLPLVRRAGGVPRFVTPRAAALPARPRRRSRRPSRRRPRSVLFNNPLNPTATIFPRRGSRAARRLLPPLRRRSRSATRSGSTSSSTAAGTVRCSGLPGMRERTVKIGSAGKIFSLTGWKVGFVCAAPTMHEGARQGAPVPHLHDAAEPAGRGRLRPRQGRCLFRGHARRPRSAAATASPAGLASLGFPVLPSRGDLFRQRRHRARSARRDDADFLPPPRASSTASPRSRSRPSTPKGAVRNVVRFCFAKRDATLDAALERLAGVARRAA